MTAEMSVVLVTRGPFDRIRKTVSHLQRQTASSRLELVIAAPSRASIAFHDDDVQGFAAVQIVEVGAVVSMSDARAAAVRCATAPLIAFAEDHCYPHPEWADRLLDAYRRPEVGAVGPATVNGNPRTLVSWINFLMTFVRWSPPVTEGSADGLPWHNTSYRRDLLLAYGSRLPSMLSVEGFLHADLLSKGHHLYLVSRAQIRHVNVSLFGYTLPQAFLGGRLYGAARAARGEWGLGRRLLYILASPLVPFVRLRRSCRDIVRIGMEDRLIPRAVPLLFLALIVHALGEATGYAVGPGEADRAYSDYELSRVDHLCESDRREELGVEPAIGDRRSRTLAATVGVFAADFLMLPTGLATTAFLTRRLGPDGYGLFVLASSVIVWAEWSITSIFSRATVKFVSEADDWRPVGAAVTWLHLLAGLAATALVFGLAGPFAVLLNEPRLANYLRLFSLDIPLFVLAQAHRNILVGTGGFRERAMASAGRWLVRLAIIVLLVELGLSVTGAIVGSIIASIAELTIGRMYVRPEFRRPAGYPLKPLWGYAIPMLVAALSLRLFDKLDLFSLKVLGGSAEQAGIYGAAQSLALLPGVFALSFAPLLLSTFTHLRRTGDLDRAHVIGRDALRFAVAMFPFAALTAGSASEIVQLILGARFVSAAPLFALLIVGAVALLTMSAAGAILIGADKPVWTAALAGLLIPLAIATCLVFIPLWGPPGAALATMTTAAAGALASMLAVRLLIGIGPPAATWLRTALLAPLAYFAAAGWLAPGLWVVVKLGVLSVAVALGYVVLGEFAGGNGTRTSAREWPAPATTSVLETE